MKKYLIILLVVITNKTNAQWQWAKQIGGIATDFVRASSDGNNLYVSGTFVYNCFLDGNILASNGYNDWFLAKYDLTGINLIWHKQIGNFNTSSTEESGQIALVTNNAIYCIGQFYNTLTIDGNSITSNGEADGFIAKFDLNGTCQWLKSAGGLQNDRGGYLTEDSAGHIYWSIVIDSDAGGSIETYSLNKGNCLVKFDYTNGSVLAVKNPFIKGGYLTGIKINNNELYFAGVTENDTTIVDSDTLFANNVGDALLAKCDLNGNIVWARRFGNTTLTGDFATDITFDASNNLYVVGRYRDNMTIDGNSVSCNGSNNYDLFIAKFDNSGTNQWVRGSYSGTSNYYAYATQIVNDIDGNFYIIGMFTNSALFGLYNISTTNPSDMFLARYDQNGDCLGVCHFGSALGYIVETDANGDVLVSGVFDGTVTIGSTTFTSYGQKDGFIAKSDAITGIGEGRLSGYSQLIIYANPNRGTFTIKVPKTIQTFNDAWLYVYDNTGKETARFSLDKESDTPHFQINKTAKGTYNVKLVQGNEIYIGQMVVE
jgi:hypothetical protein